MDTNDLKRQLAEAYLIEQGLQKAHKQDRKLRDPSMHYASKSPLVKPLTGNVHYLIVDLLKTWHHTKKNPQGPYVQLMGWKSIHQSRGV